MVILVLHHRFTQPILGRIITRLFIYCRGSIAYIDVSYYDLDIRQGKSTASFVRDLCIFLRLFIFSHVLYNRSFSGNIRFGRVKCDLQNVRIPCVCRQRWRENYQQGH